MKFKMGDLLTNKQHKNDKCWSLLIVICTYTDDIGNYYWVKTLYHETDDESVPTYMDIHDEQYMEILGMRKLIKGEYEELLAKVI